MSLIHVQIQRGLKVSFNALHALVENCKKEIEIRKFKYKSKICNYSCNSHRLDSKSSPLVKTINTTQPKSQNKKKRKNKEKKEAQKHEANAEATKCIKDNGKQNKQSYSDKATINNCVLAQTVNGLAIENDKYCDILESTRLDETLADQRLDAEEEMWIKVHGKRTRNKKMKDDKLKSQKSIEILPKAQTNTQEPSLINTEINEIKKKQSQQQQIQHQKQQEYQQQQIQIQHQTWLQQQDQYEHQKQNQIQQQMRINQIQTKYNPNMVSMQQTKPSNRYQPQQSPNCPENPNQSSSAAEIIIQKMTKMIEDLEDRLTTYAKCLSYHKAGTFQCPMHKNEIQRLQAKTNGNGKNSEIFNMDKLNEILEEHTDKLTTYTRCMVFDKQVNYKNHSELEKAIFHKTLNHVKEIKDPLIEEEFEKAVEEIMEIAVRMKAKEA